MAAGAAASGVGESKEQEGDGGSKEADSDLDEGGDKEVRQARPSATIEEIAAAENAVKKLRVRLQALMRGIGEGSEPVEPLGSKRICLELGMPLDVKDLEGRIMWRPAEIIGLKFQDGQVVGMADKGGKLAYDAAPGGRIEEPTGAVSQVLVHFNGWESNWDEWIDV